MALPINIEQLIQGKTIEWERIEFKRGFNPEEIMHTLCAFANDINNWGGGYIIIGIAEQNGMPILPPQGIDAAQIDGFQKELLQIGHKLMPNYFAIAQPYQIEGKHILVIWCPAGDNRPYTALSTLGKAAQRQAYVRIGSSSVAARGENSRRLLELAARIPFDDRVNNQANLHDLDLGLMRAHLQEIKSTLFNASAAMPFEDLCRSMQIAKGPNEDIRPVNVGLLFFSNQPERFFKRAWIELVWHKDHTGKAFKELYFKGPLQTQLRNAISYINTNIIAEQVIKKADKAEPDRFYNYPFAAVEEALANAVYHKSYETGSPIEVQVFPDKITILSHPGPVPPVNAKILSEKRHIIAREYRNRRIGDFLKELKLTEGRGTGFPTIYNTMAANESPAPLFETDELHYVLVTLPIRINDQASDQASDQAGNQAKYQVYNTLDDIFNYLISNSNQASDQASDQALVLVSKEVHAHVSTLLMAAKTWQSKADLLAQIGLSKHSVNRKKYIDPLTDLNCLELEYPNNPTHPRQRYKTTEMGLRLLDLIHKK